MRISNITAMRAAGGHLLITVGITDDKMCVMVPLPEHMAKAVDQMFDALLPEILDTAVREVRFAQQRAAVEKGVRPGLVASGDAAAQASQRESVFGFKREGEDRQLRRDDLNLPGGPR